MLLCFCYRLQVALGTSTRVCIQVRCVCGAVGVYLFTEFRPTPSSRFVVIQSIARQLELGGERKEDREGERQKDARTDEPSLNT